MLYALNWAMAEVAEVAVEVLEQAWVREKVWAWVFPHQLS